MLEAAPIITSLVCEKSTSGFRSISVRIGRAASSSARTVFSEPLPARPMGVLMASTMTASGMCVAPARFRGGAGIVVAADRRRAVRCAGAKEAPGSRSEGAYRDEVPGRLGWLIGLTVMLAAVHRGAGRTRSSRTTATAVRVRCAPRSLRRRAATRSLSPRPERSDDHADQRPADGDPKPDDLRSRRRQPHDHQRYGQRHRGFRHRHRAAHFHVGNDLRSHDHGRPRQGPGGGGIDAESVATLTLDGDVITGNQSTIRDNDRLPAVVESSSTVGR